MEDNINTKKIKILSNRDQVEKSVRNERVMRLKRVKKVDHEYFSTITTLQRGKL